MLPAAPAPPPRFNHGTTRNLTDTSTTLSDLGGGVLRQKKPITGCPKIRSLSTKTKVTERSPEPAEGRSRSARRTPIIILH